MLIDLEQESSRDSQTFVKFYSVLFDRILVWNYYVGKRDWSLILLSSRLYVLQKFFYELGYVEMGTNC